MQATLASSSSDFKAQIVSMTQSFEAKLQAAADEEVAVYWNPP